MMFPFKNMNPRIEQKWRPVIEGLENSEKQKFNHTEFADFLETCANLFVNEEHYIYAGQNGQIPLSQIKLDV